MQSVSPAWKEKQKQNFLPESYAEITMNVGAPDSQAAASPTDNGHEVFSGSSKLAGVIEKNATRFATLEPYLWKLNGTFKIVPDAAPYGEQLLQS